MKKLLLICGLFIGLQTFAQNNIPEFKNKVMFVESGTTLAELEKTDMRTSYNATEPNRLYIYIVANGKNSSIIHTGAASEKFIVKIESGIDPANVVELFKFDIIKKNRSILVVKMVVGKDKTVDLPKAKIMFKKVAEGTYEVSASAQLESGEYCFIVNRPNISALGAQSPQSLIGYCFSVK